MVLLPSYAPDLNPAEGVWANMKNGLGNLAAHNVDQLAAVVKNRLKRIRTGPRPSAGSSPRPDSPSNRTTISSPDSDLSRSVAKITLNLSCAGH